MCISCLESVIIKVDKEIKKRKSMENTKTKNTKTKADAPKPKKLHDRVGVFVGDVDEQAMKDFPLEEVIRIGIDPKWADLIGGIEEGNK